MDELVKLVNVAFSLDLEHGERVNVQVFVVHLDARRLGATRVEQIVAELFLLPITQANSCYTLLVEAASRTRIVATHCAWVREAVVGGREEQQARVLHGPVVTHKVAADKGSADVVQRCLSTRRNESTHYFRISVTSEENWSTIKSASSQQKSCRGKGE